MKMKTHIPKCIGLAKALLRAHLQLQMPILKKNKDLKSII